QARDPLYPRAQSALLLKRIAAAAVEERTAADPEAAFGLAWGYLTLARAAGSPVPESGQQALRAAIPLTGRAAPLSLKEKGQGFPTGPMYPERMKAVAVFEPDEFLRPFQALLPGR